jgi:hypothetical protein
MIKGAVELITGVPGRFVDPFHLASSQSDSFAGYILIAYATIERVWDLLLLQGRTVAEAARITAHATPADRQGDGLLERRQVEPSDVESRFGTAALRDRSRVYLFEATALQVDPFVKTLRSERPGAQSPGRPPLARAARPAGKEPERSASHRRAGSASWGSSVFRVPGDQISAAAGRVSDEVPERDVAPLYT